MNSTESETKLKVFLCHASEDKPKVLKLSKKLSTESWIEPWVDKKNSFLDNPGKSRLN